MRTLISIILVILCIPAFSQGYKDFEAPEGKKKEPIPRSVVIDDYIEKYSHLDYPETYLISSRSCMYLSWGFGAASAGFFYASMLNDEPDQLLYVASGCFALTSLIFGVKSVVHIGRAGKAMRLERYKNEKKELSLYVNPQSVGFKLTF